jgi:hypothetical protein
MFHEPNISGNFKCKTTNAVHKYNEHLRSQNVAQNNGKKRMLCVSKMSSI